MWDCFDRINPKSTCPWGYDINVPQGFWHMTLPYSKDSHPHLFSHPFARGLILKSINTLGKLCVIKAYPIIAQNFPQSNQTQSKTTFIGPCSLWCGHIHVLHQNCWGGTKKLKWGKEVLLFWVCHLCNHDWRGHRNLVVSFGWFLYGNVDVFLVGMVFLNFESDVVGEGAREGEGNGTGTQDRWLWPWHHGVQV